MSGSTDSCCCWLHAVDRQTSASLAGMVDVGARVLGFGESWDSWDWLSCPNNFDPMIATVIDDDPFLF